jgi:hypothetical protein
MAEKGFGAKKINLIGVSGTPKIDSVNNLNINAVEVAISTDVSIGGTVKSDLKVGAGYSFRVGTAITITAQGNLQTIGVVTAAQFVGDGSGLTNITGVGGGIEVKDNGVVVGTAGTVNFGENLDVSPVSGAAVTITAPARTIYQENYSGINPIVSTGSSITIGSTSNASGSFYVSAASTPGSNSVGHNGDIWYYTGN